MMLIENIFYEPLDNRILRKFVLDYLKHYAYLGTLEAFIKETEEEKVEEKKTVVLHKRERE